MNSAFEKAAERLAKLPRPERFEELIKFPAKHMFKAIGKGGGFADDVQGVISNFGYTDTILVERPSKQGRYCSITFSVDVQDGAALDRIYSALETLPSLKLLL